MRCMLHTVIIWDTFSWHPLTIFTDHTAPVHSMAWDADGTYFASVSADGAIFITDYH